MLGQTPFSSPRIPTIPLSAEAQARAEPQQATPTSSGCNNDVPDHATPIVGQRTSPYRFTDGITRILKSHLTNIRPPLPNPPLPPRPYVPPHRRPSPLATRMRRDLPPNPVTPPELPDQLWPNCVPAVYHAGLGKPMAKKILLSNTRQTISSAIRDVTVVGGYKWIQSPLGTSGPTIVVPGIPDIWIGAEDQVGAIQPDSMLEGNRELADYNADSVPAEYSPLEPVFLCLLSPHVLANVQIVTGRNNLKKLFKFCFEHAYQPSKLHLHGYRDRIKPFRIDARPISGTQLITLERWETPRDKQEQEPQSWHLSYHEQTTMSLYSGADRTSGCHRVIKYDFGGITIIVKADVDAALPWDGALPDQDAERQADGYETEDEDAMSLDTVQGTVATDAWSSFTPTGPNSLLSGILRTTQLTSSGINILRSQAVHPPQGHLITVKTRHIDTRGPNSGLRGINRSADVYAGMVFGQVSNMYLARHHRGDFSLMPLEKRALGEGDLREMEVEYLVVMQSTRALLGWMLEVVRRYGSVGFVGDQGRIVAYELESPELKFSREVWDVIRRGTP